MTSSVIAWKITQSDQEHDVRSDGRLRVAAVSISLL